MQVCKRRVAGAEVVERELDAARLECVQLQLDALTGRDEHALGQLEGQQVGRQCRAVERDLDVLDEIGMLELPCGDIDGDLDVAADAVAQTRCVCASLAQHPAADRHDQA